MIEYCDYHEKKHTKKFGCPQCESDKRLEKRITKPKQPKQKVKKHE